MFLMVVGNVLNDVLFLLYCGNFIIPFKHVQTIIRTAIATIYGHLNKLNWASIEPPHFVGRPYRQYLGTRVGKILKCIVVSL